MKIRTRIRKAVLCGAGATAAASGMAVATLFTGHSTTQTQPK